MPPKRVITREALRKEFIRRQSVGNAAEAYADEIYLRHLREPVPGVYAMSNDLYLQLRERGASQEDFERAFKEAEEKFLAGETYTMEDYLRPR